MIDLDYLKRSKEEIKNFIEIFRSLNEKTFNNLIIHMQKSMLFMADSLAGRHVDLITEYAYVKEKTYPYFGNEFFETYFLLSSINKKNIKFLTNEKIIITGKKPYKLDKEYFKELAKTIINYFNIIYSRVENNGV
ncbi:MAG: hypothetical protein WC376_04775 [Candidatus Nanoarchaeia archaeon]|jgi:hypothetical protein